ncbi:MAG: GIY-YIG nuclease family protein [Dehalococcoidales bacterium]|jgi:putative endonuclease
MKQYYVYIMSSISGVLYTGVTNNLPRRVLQHKKKTNKGFTAKYNVKHLVYYENTPDIGAAIAREKQIKGWTRAKKVQLINSVNPEWRDLSKDFMDEEHMDEE